MGSNKFVKLNTPKKQKDFDIPESYFNISIVSDRFTQLHWHTWSPENIECLPWPWKKDVETAILIK